jgi:hypothetical protein
MVGLVGGALLPLLAAGCGGRVTLIDAGYFSRVVLESD